MRQRGGKGEGRGRGRGGGVRSGRLIGSDRAKRQAERRTNKGDKQRMRGSETQIGSPACKRKETDGIREVHKQTGRQTDRQTKETDKKME